MSGDPAPSLGSPLAKIEQELASYASSSVTARVLTALSTAIPGTPALPSYTTLEQAAGAVMGGVPPDVIERARVLLSDPRIDQALFAARTIDTGDTGLTIVSGVRSAMALFFGSSETRSAALAQQQRADAAVKAFGLAYLVTRLLPVAPATRIELVRSVPAGLDLLQYYGAIEIAVPFGDTVAASDGRFVAELVRTHSRELADKVLGVVGREGGADAEVMLGHLVGELDRAALAAVPYTAGLAEQVRALLPAAAVPGDLFDLVAAGVDALPCYRYLVARLAIEASLALAKHELMPDVPLPEPPDHRPAAPLPPPPPVPEGLRTLGSGPLPVRSDTPADPDPPVHPVPAGDHGPNPGSSSTSGSGDPDRSPATGSADPDRSPAFGPADRGPVAPPGGSASDALVPPGSVPPAPPLAPPPAGPPPVGAPSGSSLGSPVHRPGPTVAPPLTAAPSAARGAAWPTVAPSSGSPPAPVGATPPGTAPAGPSVAQVAAGALGASVALDAPPPPPLEPRSAAPAPTASTAPTAPTAFRWPTRPLPEPERLRGFYLGEDEPPRWRIFTVEGVFTDRPWAHPAGVDWEAHRSAGSEVATYRRMGDEVVLTDPDGTTRRARYARDDRSLTLDGVRWARADWDLTGRTLDGRWDGPEGPLVLRSDGAAALGLRAGTYTLGVGRIAFRWEDGTTAEATLLSDLRPSSRRPATLWLGGQRYVSLGG